MCPFGRLSLDILFLPDRRYLVSTVCADEAYDILPVIYMYVSSSYLGVINFFSF